MLTARYHHDGLVVCQKYRHMISDTEFSAINQTLGDYAYGGGTAVQPQAFAITITAIDRVLKSVLSTITDNRSKDNENN